jgi:hypothetical protein
MPTRPSDAGNLAAPAQARRSLSTRALKLMWQNPRMAHTLLREEYRQKFGIALDRRFQDGLSGPPVNLNLNLTRRCNLKCLMCEQHRHDPGPPPALSRMRPLLQPELYLNRAALVTLPSSADFTPQDALWYRSHLTIFFPFGGQCHRS